MDFFVCSTQTRSESKVGHNDAMCVSEADLKGRRGASGALVLVTVGGRRGDDGLKTVRARGARRRRQPNHVLVSVLYPFPL